MNFRCCCYEKDTERIFLNNFQPSSLACFTHTFFLIIREHLQISTKIIWFRNVHLNAYWTFFDYSVGVCSHIGGRLCVCWFVWWTFVHQFVDSRSNSLSILDLTQVGISLKHTFSQTWVRPVHYVQSYLGLTGQTSRNGQGIRHLL